MMNSMAALPEQLYSAACATFQQAARAVGKTIACDYRIADRLVRLQFAGPALLDFTKPLAHLATPYSVRKPDLTVCLWDSASTRTPPLDVDWLSRDEMSEFETCVHRSASMVMSITGPRRELNILHLQQNLAFWHVPAASTLPWGEIYHPFMRLLHWWTATQRMQMLHAAAVGTPAGGALLVGRGGSGKSTTALACLDAGMNYVSDDYCVLSMQPFARAFSIFSTARLTPESLRMLPRLESALEGSKNFDGEKFNFTLYPHFPERIVNRLPIRAVLLPHVTEGEISLTWASPADGLKTLAPSTIIQMHAHQPALSLMAELVRQVPCYHLNLGGSLLQVPAAIRRLLDELAACQPAGAAA